MYLHDALLRRADAGNPVRVCLIGAGKFGSMFLSQVPTTPGLEVAVIADLRPDAARAACRAVGWDDARIAATAFTDDAGEALGRGNVDVVIEATGNPAAGLTHARAAIAAGKHVVMVNVEADALAGTLLAREAETAGGVYSLAYGDQPALIAEIVDWHALPARLSRLHPGHGLEPLRSDSGRGRGSGNESEDVQLVPRRHEIGAGNGGGRQCL